MGDGVGGRDVGVTGGRSIDVGVGIAVAGGVADVSVGAIRASAVGVGDCGMGSDPGGGASVDWGSNAGGSVTALVAVGPIGWVSVAGGRAGSVVHAANTTVVMTVTAMASFMIIAFGFCMGICDFGVASSAQTAPIVPRVQQLRNDARAGLRSRR